MATLAWDIPTLLSLGGLAALMLFTPGPNNIMLANSGATFGLRRTVPHMAGVSLGFGVMLFLVGVGLGEVFERSPLLRQGMRWAGAVMLFYLAWRIATAGKAKVAARARPISFIEASAFQWVNPKAWTMQIGVASQFITGSSAWDALFCALVFIVMGAFSSLTWAAFGAALQRFLKTPRALRIFNVTMGILVASCVVFLII